MTGSPGRRRRCRTGRNLRLRRRLARASTTGVRTPRTFRDAARAARVARKATARPDLTAWMADAVAAGIPVAIQHRRVRVALVDADRLVQALLPLYRARISTTVPPPWRCLIAIDRVPITVRAISVDAALDRMVTALREYAATWPDLVKADPVHERQWALTQILAYLDDHQIRDWLTETGTARRNGEPNPSGTPT